MGINLKKISITHTKLLYIDNKNFIMFLKKGINLFGTTLNLKKIGLNLKYFVQPDFIQYTNKHDYALGCEAFMEVKIS